MILREPRILKWMLQTIYYDLPTLQYLDIVENVTEFAYKKVLRNISQLTPSEHTSNSGQMFYIWKWEKPS